MYLCPDYNSAVVGGSSKEEAVSLAPGNGDVRDVKVGNKKLFLKNKK